MLTNYVKWLKWESWLTSYVQWLTNYVNREEWKNGEQIILNGIKLKSMGIEWDNHVEHMI